MADGNLMLPTLYNRKYIHKWFQRDDAMRYWKTYLTSTEIRNFQWRTRTNKFINRGRRYMHEKIVLRCGYHSASSKILTSASSIVCSVTWYTGWARVSMIGTVHVEHHCWDQTLLYKKSLSINHHIGISATLELEKYLVETTVICCG